MQQMDSTRNISVMYVHLERSMGKWVLWIYINNIKSKLIYLNAIRFLFLTQYTTPLLQRKISKSAIGHFPNILGNFRPNFYMPGTFTDHFIQRFQCPFVALMSTEFRLIICTHITCMIKRCFRTQSASNCIGSAS